MNVLKRLAAVGCASLMLFSANGIFQQSFIDFPAVITASAATTHNISTGSITITDSGEYIITGSTTTNKIIIQSGSPTITLNGVSIDLSSSGGCPFEIQSGSCILTLSNESTLKASSDNPAIRVEAGKSLTIDGNGMLNATGGAWSAGIGGGTNGRGGTITINNGTINATGGRNGPGIGCGSSGGYGGDITINGGVITATGGGVACAGIGGGGSSGGGTIKITGGTITATGDNGAGIGSSGASAGTITITGGTITATGGGGSAGIGGGGDGGTITITGGTITAKGSDGAENIGHAANNTDCGTQNYTGGTINGETYPLSPTYTVTIPASVQLNNTATIKATSLNGIEQNHLKINMQIISGGSLSYDDDTITYAIKQNNKNGSEMSIGQSVVIAKETNTESSVTLYFSEPTSTPRYVGRYQGTVTFTISTEK